MLCFPPLWSVSDALNLTSCKFVFLSLKVTPGTLLVESLALVVRPVCKTIRMCHHLRSCDSQCGTPLRELYEDILQHGTLHASYRKKNTL